MERKLATIQRVTALKPIPGADAIECARVMGWDVVVKKGEFEVGDLGVFFEIDSVLPEGQLWAEFMRPKGFRVKTCKLRGQISQGLFLSLDILPPGAFEGPPGLSFINEGTEVTGFLNVAKYDPPIPGPDIVGPFPGDVRKTDEIRLQSILPVLDELKDKPFYVTVKLDGMSGTFVRREEGLQVCMREWMVKEGTGAHWVAAKRYDLANKLPIGYAIQGEVCGPGIQKNRLGLKEVDLFVFNVIDLKSGNYFDWDSVTFFCHKYGLKTVPFDFEVDEPELANFPFTLENFLELAKGEYPGTGNRREGIVVRPLVNCRSEALGGDRLSFKVINNDFLLKDEE